MNELEVRDKFNKIVEDNNFVQDVLIPVVADDGRLKRVMRWVLTDPTYPDSSEETDYDDVVDLVRTEYGLTPDRVNEMLNLCENNIIEELNHGN